MKVHKTTYHQKQNPNSSNLGTFQVLTSPKGRSIQILAGACSNPDQISHKQLKLHSECWVYGLSFHHFVLESTRPFRSRNQVEQTTRSARRSWCNISMFSIHVWGILSSRWTIFLIGDV